MNNITQDLLQNVTHSILDIIIQKSLLLYFSLLHFVSLLLWQPKRASRCALLIYHLSLPMENLMKWFTWSSLKNITREIPMLFVNYTSHYIVSNSQLSWLGKMAKCVKPKNLKQGPAAGSLIGLLIGELD